MSVKVTRYVLGLERHPSSFSGLRVIWHQCFKGRDATQKKRKRRNWFSRGESQREKMRGRDRRRRGDKKPVKW